jgi:hypothetical protein
VLGSKFEGTGLENEHIGHTQVALSSLTGAGDGAAGRNGVPPRVGDDDNGLFSPL